MRSLRIQWQRSKLNDPSTTSSGVMEGTVPVRSYDWIAHHTARTPNKLAIVDLASERRFTYQELDRRIGGIAGYLRRTFGIDRGDRIAVLAHNTTDILELQFACGRLGAIFVPLNWRLTNPELSYIISDATPNVIIYDGDFAASVARLCQQHAGLRQMPRAERGHERAIDAGYSLASSELVSHDDISTIMYTSGTTGSPKGAMITHGSIFWNAVNASWLSITEKTTGLSFLPMFHISGLNSYANPILHAGGTAVIMRNFDADQALRAIDDRALGVTHIHGVPATYQFMAQHHRFPETDLSRLLRATVGGAPMPLPVLETWHQRGLTLTQGFGMTETGPAVLTLPVGDARRKAGSVGKPLLHTEVTVRHENGTPTRQGEVGELWVKGPNVSPGYWNRPEVNQTTFVDGWFRTGDAVRVDAEGFYYIVDRWKDMYISGGENVYPAEVEQILYQIEAIAEAAVIGIRDERWGEVGRAIITVKSGRDLSEAEVLAHCRANLAGFKTPRSIFFVTSLPRTATGKIHKPTLRQQFNGP
ncbi:MAG: fatty-acyl-CoA synthase [Alphaproteobacteria bacterium]|jgi:fatty-acyl-CoA synthase|nr:fatty-acyl-CoA synthase [Alphaproteobacteria bacterium]